MHEQISRAKDTCLVEGSKDEGTEDNQVDSQISNEDVIQMCQFEQKEAFMTVQNPPEVNEPKAPDDEIPFCSRNEDLLELSVFCDVGQVRDGG
jgi:hypothetical protein